MTRLQKFLVLDGVFLVVGALFLFFLVMRKKRGNQFRDDLWEQRKQAEQTGRLAEFEDKVDNKIRLEHKPDPKVREPMDSAASTFRIPNFRGPSHEILGIPANSSEDLVKRAFKHWIKRYHPDRVAHLGSGYVEQARRRAEQLNSARDALLKAAKK